MAVSTLEYPTIRNSSVVDSVKDWIVDQLIKGNLHPGDQLPTEAELCAKLGAGRNSVREAIKKLEAQGVVYIKRSEGTFISSDYDPKLLSPVLYGLILKKNNWADIVELRKALDIGSLYVLMEKELGAERKQKLTAALERMERAVSTDTLDAVEINDADASFHAAIAELTDNPQLISICDFINQVTLPSRIDTTNMVIDSGRIRDYARLHRDLHDIIIDRDKQKIEKTVTDHYVFWKETNPQFI